MSNHGFVSSKRNFKKEQIILDLQEINQRRFKGLLTIVDSKWGDNGSWFISYPEHSHPNGFNIWIRSAKKLEHRHTHGWSFYLEVAFSEELCYKYNGILSDEGITEKWKPDPSKHLTYTDWLDDKFGYYKNNILLYPTYLLMFNLEMKSLPAIFKDC